MTETRELSNRPSTPVQSNNVLLLQVVVIPIENIEFWDPVNSVLSILHGYADSVSAVM